jgi:hypothetical protein
MEMQRDSSTFVSHWVEAGFTNYTAFILIKLYITASEKEKNLKIRIYKQG